MLITIDPAEPEPWLIAKVSGLLARGQVAVVPTDTVYAIGCALSQSDAVRRIYASKQLDPKKPLSILLPDMAAVGSYVRGLQTPVFRLLKRVLPGPYTFIFTASPEIPKIMLRKRKTIGIRIPDNPIVLALLAELGEPILTTSVRTPDDELVTDPIQVEQQLGNQIDVVVDGGPLLPEPSTVVDVSGDVPVLVRAGKGDVDALDLF